MPVSNQLYRHPSPYFQQLYFRSLLPVPDSNLRIQEMLLSVSHPLSMEVPRYSSEERFPLHSYALPDLRSNPEVLLYCCNQTYKCNRPLSDCLSPSVCSVFQETCQYPYGMCRSPSMRITTVQEVMFLLSQHHAIRGALSFSLS